MRSESSVRKSIFYDERHAPFEDSHVCFEILRTWNFGFVHQVLTYSRRDNESFLSNPSFGSSYFAFGEGGCTARISIGR